MSAKTARGRAPAAAVTFAVACAVVTAACSSGGGAGGAGDGAAGRTTTTTVRAKPQGPALSVAGDPPVYAIAWDRLRARPRYALPVEGDDDPLFHIHTDPGRDGFLFSLELYTQFGPGWSGDVGTFAVDCRTTGTGICVHFDPDGDGELDDLGAGFDATGEVVIRQLDENGYDLTITDLAFAGGATIDTPLVLTGGPPENPGGEVSD